MEDKAKEAKVMGLALTTLTVFRLDVKRIREINKEYFEFGDSTSTISSEGIYGMVRDGLELVGNVDLDAVMEKLPNEQMREDLHDALIVSMASKDACVLTTAMFFLKGMIIPLIDELKDSKQTIQTLSKATGNN